jgi:hypothetical protein
MRFGGYYANISLLGAVARNLGRYLGSGLYRVTQVAMAIYVAISVSLIGFLFWLLQRKPVLPAERLRELDFEYSLVVALIPLLSPLSWGHYMPVLLLPMLVLSRRILADQPNGLPVSALAGLLMALAIPAWTLHFNTRVTPETAAMLALWSWIVILYWRWKAGSAV